MIFWLALLLPGLLLSGIHTNGDTGLWLEQSFIKHFPENNLLKFNIHERWANDCKTFYLQRYEVIGLHKLDPEKLVGGGFALERSRSNNTWIQTNFYFLEGHFIQKLLEGKLKQRLRVSLASSNEPEYVRVRYRIHYNTPWHFTKQRLNPWISNEFFFRENHRHQVGGLYQNRFRIGMHGSLIKHVLSYSLYLQWLSLKQEPSSPLRWNQVFDLGVTTFVSF